MRISERTNLSITNLILLVGCLFFGWKFWDLAFVYWLETVVVTIVLYVYAWMYIIRTWRKNRHERWSELTVAFVLMAILLGYAVLYLSLPLIGLAHIAAPATVGTANLIPYLYDAFAQYWMIAIFFILSHTLVLHTSTPLNTEKNKKLGPTINAVFIRIMVLSVGVLVVGCIYVASTLFGFELTLLSTLLMLFIKTGMEWKTTNVAAGIAS